MTLSNMDQPLLRDGASVRVIAPSRWIEKSVADDVLKQSETSGLDVSFSEQCFRQHHQLAGDDGERAREFEQVMADPSVDAVWFGRGGYGAGRMMEHVDWSRLTALCGGQPRKVVIGYSDATPLLECVSRLGLAWSVHGAMPVDVMSEANCDAPKKLLQDLIATPRGELNQRALARCSAVRPGAASGPLRGGNLTLLTNMLFGDHRMRFAGSILVIEDVEEYDYAIDRDLLCLRQAGVLAELAAIVIGQFTKTILSSVPFDQTVAEMVLHHTREFDFPILQGLPSGHGTPNEPLLIDDVLGFSAIDGSMTWSRPQSDVG
ncbi:MAG: LD-carboxypeptidase [Pseudomonadota bacterium]